MIFSCDKYTVSFVGGNFVVLDHSFSGRNTLISDFKTSCELKRKEEWDLLWIFEISAVDSVRVIFINSVLNDFRFASKSFNAAFSVQFYGIINRLL